MTSLRLPRFAGPFLTGSLARFTAVGVLNTAVGLSLIFVCKAAGMGDFAANFTGYAIAIAAGFALNKRWTFGHRGQVPAALARYLLVLAVAYGANLAATLFAIEVLRLNSYLGQAIGILPYAVTGYLGARWFAFAPTRSGH